MGLSSSESTRSERDAGIIEGIVLILPSFLAIMGAIVLVPILPAMAVEYEGTPNLAFLLQATLTVPSVVVVLFSPVAGILGDKLGRKRLLVRAMLLYSLLGLSPLILDSIYSVLASRVLLGFAEATVLVLATTLLGDAFSGNKRARWFGYQIGGGALVAIPLLSAAGYLGEFGWRYAFLVYALPLLMLVLVLFLAQERDHANPEGDAKTDEALNQFPWRRVFVVGSIGLFSSVSFFVMQLQQGLALSEVGVVSPERLGNLTAMASIGAPVGAFGFRFIAHWRPTALLTLGFSGAAAGLLGVAFGSSSTTIVPSIFVGLVGTNILLPTLMSWALRGVVAGFRARVMGIWQGIFAVGQFVSAMMFAFSMQALGSAKTAFLIMGLLVAIAAVIALMAYLKTGNAHPRAGDE